MVYIIKASKSSDRENLNHADKRDSRRVDLRGAVEPKWRIESSIGKLRIAR